MISRAPGRQRRAGTTSVPSSRRFVEPAPPPSPKYDREVLMAMPNGQLASDSELPSCEDCLRAAWWTSAMSFDGIVSAKSERKREEIW